MKFTLTIGCLALAAMAATAPAQTINERRENQQQRIAQGVGSGSLTAGETARLEKREARVNRQIRRDRAANGGKLTPQERRQVIREQSRLSRSIYRDKHNARTRP